MSIETKNIAGAPQPEEDLTNSSSLNPGCKGAIKDAGAVALAIGSASAMFIAEDERIKAVGGVIFLGGLFYPVYLYTKNEIALLRNWRRRKDTINE